MSRFNASILYPLEARSFSVEDFPRAAIETDDTARILRAMNALPANGVLVFEPGKNYILANYVTIPKSMTISGYGTTLTFVNAPVFGAQGYCFFYANAISNLAIYGPTFDGNKANVPANATNNVAVWLQDCVGAKVIDCVGVNLQGGGSNLNTAFAFVNQSSNGIARGNIVHDSTGGAVFMQGHESVMSGNIAYNLNDIGFVVNAASCYSSVIEGNIVDNCSGGGIGVENGPYNISVVGNQVRNIPNGYGIAVLEIGTGQPVSQDITITGNVVRGNSGINPCNGIILSNANDYTVTGNVVEGINTGNANNSGLSLAGTDWVATGNKVTVDCYGALISGSVGNISNNHVKSNSSVAIFINQTMNELTCNGNAIEANVGIQLNVSGGATLSGNLANNRITLTGASPVRYNLGAVGLSTNIKLQDAQLTGFGSSDMVRESGISAQTFTILAGASQQVVVNVKEYAASVSWGDGCVDVAGCVVAFTGWANSGQTATFEVTNTTAASVTMNHLYYNLYGQKTNVDGATS